MNTAHLSSFVLISILRGQPRTPPSGDNLGILDYHLKSVVYNYNQLSLVLMQVCVNWVSILVGVVCLQVRERQVEIWLLNSHLYI